MNGFRRTVSLCVYTLLGCVFAAALAGCELRAGSYAQAPGSVVVPSPQGTSQEQQIAAIAAVVIQPTDPIMIVP